MFTISCAVEMVIGHRLCPALAIRVSFGAVSTLLDLLVEPIPEGPQGDSRADVLAHAGWRVERRLHPLSALRLKGTPDLQHTANAEPLPT